jgi:murein DD-endopeptidase MepM/ murein hydrolase activator NlpD
MTTSHRDLAQLDPWQRSLERSLHRRAITPQVRRTVARRRRASIALSTLMVAGPTGGLFAGAGFGGRVDVAQASPATRAIDSGPAPAAMALEVGSRGDEVAEIQRQLGVTADGLFGPVTHAAVTAFQARNGLDVDGVVGPVTWTALFGLQQAAAAAGAGDGAVAVVVRERSDGRGSDSGSAGTGERQPATGGRNAPAGVGETGPLTDDAQGTPGGQGDAPAATPPPAPVSAPAPADGACGSLRLSSPVDGTVTSGFGPRWGRNHDGLDIAAATGTPIRAAECGVVSFAGTQSGYGNMVCVKHSSRFETCYAHMTRYAVAQGQRVEQGQVIGYVGCTGNCTGPHLHFETRVDGAARDPRPYLGGAGIPGAPTVKAAAKAKLTASIRKDVAKARTAAKTTFAQPGATATPQAATAGGQVATTAVPTTQAPTTAPAPAAPAPTATTPAPVATPAPETTTAAPAPVAVTPEPAAPVTPAPVTPTPDATTPPAYDAAPTYETTPQPSYTTPAEPTYDAPSTPAPSTAPEPAATPAPTATSEPTATDATASPDPSPAIPPATP